VISTRFLLSSIRGENQLGEIYCHLGQERKMGLGMGSRGRAEVGVATLALSSQPRQGFARLQAKREARESRRMFSGM